MGGPPGKPGQVGLPRTPAGNGKVIPWHVWISRCDRREDQRGSSAGGQRSDPSGDDLHGVLHITPCSIPQVTNGIPVECLRTADHQYPFCRPPLASPDSPPPPRLGQDRRPDPGQHRKLLHPKLMIRTLVTCPLSSHIDHVERPLVSVRIGNPGKDTMTDFDSIDFFSDPSVVENPYPYFEHLRENCPAFREPHHGVVAVTGYDATVAVYRDRWRESSPAPPCSPKPNRSSRRRSRPWHDFGAVQLSAEALIGTSIRSACSRW